VRTFESVWTKLLEKGPAYRKAFVGAQLKRLIPFQIHALRKGRGWSQDELAKRCGLTQGVISRAEDPDYGNLTFNTAIAIAGGFDVAFIGKFVPFSEIDEYVVGLSEISAGSIPSFTEENQVMMNNLGRIPEQMVAVGGIHELGSLERILSTVDESECSFVGQTSFSAVSQIRGQQQPAVQGL
jgi:transcriptional regulator with XRE-family HTH domain